MVQEVLQNEMILASAGAGKTYQLTDRYLGLMARGVDPERIIALTFTRKAAGEFFDSILVKLARAAASEAGAANLASSLQMAELTQSDFQAMLQKLTCRLHLLSLGTLDGFFASIIRSFPFEFGLGGGFEILDEHMIAQEKGRVYRKVFQRTRTGKKEQLDFLEAFKLATFGSEESTLLRDLNGFIDNYHEIFLSAPGAAQWGNPRTIWPDGCQWLDGDAAPEGELAAEAAALSNVLDFEKMNQRQLARWEEFIEEIQSFSPGVPIPPASAIAYFLPKLLDAYEEMQMGEAAITVYKKQKLGEHECAVVSRIVRIIVGGEIANKLRQTRGIWKILDQYERAYNGLVRRRGKMTFFDLQLILGNGECSEQERPLLTQRPGAQERLRIDYRLDTRYDHWLLDEFQDTSFLQWSVIENLIDEAVQDQSGQRSLFQVGDLKQAIYAWRGGDVTLFNDIRDHYNREGDEPRIIERPLNDSWRSGPAVIEMVNAVFGNEEMLRYLFPHETVDRWRWGNHVSRHPELPGYACFVQPTSDAYGATSDDQKERRMDLMLDMLREIDPPDRGLSCAILVQTNKAGHEVVDFIRANSDIPVSSESIVHIAEDNPANAALLDLLQFAAHPGDSFAWEHLMMTPFAEYLNASEWTKERLVEEVLQESNENGFENLITTWGQRLLRFVPELDAFSRCRIEMLASAASGFDATGSRNITEFISFARSYAIREQATGGVVQVMTIHKSKGLGFDVVLLPDLGGQALTVIRRGLAVHRDSERTVEWVMSLPQKAIAMADPQLNHYHKEKEAESAYEGLCTLYVAMTRAKKAMYVIADKTPKGKSAPSANYPRLLEKTLGREGEEITFGGSSGLAIFQKGDRYWMDEVSQVQTSGSPPAPTTEVGRIDFAPSKRAARRLRRTTPSGSEEFVLSAAQLFSEKGSIARRLGAEVHALFEQIEWFSAETRNQLEAYARMHVISQEALSEVLAALDVQEIVDLFMPPSDDAEVWRERPFEMVEDGEWFTGTIDRVVLVPGKSAQIIDFKTDAFMVGGDDMSSAIDDRIASYAPQLALYRKVLARMINVPAESISCVLVFVKTGRVCTV